MRSYDFTITLDGTEVVCEYDSPESQNNVVKGTIVRESHLSTITLLDQWLRRYERIARLEELARREQLVTWAPSAQLLVPGTFAVLGDHLWRLALGGAPGEALKRARAKRLGADPGRAPHIRVRLTFKEGARDLSTLPWEFVHCPDPDFYLAAETNLVLGRYVWNGEDGQIRCTDHEKVQVLFVVCLPDRADFAEERLEIEKLKRELSAVTALDLAEVDEWDPVEVGARLGEFKEKGQPVDVVHLVALCKDDGGRPVLYLPQGDAGGAWLDPGPVVRMLTNDPANRPSLVVLHLSEWDRDPSDHFEQLAPAFVNAGIPAVLAMQYPMPPQKGRNFVRSIYESLVTGERIGEAVQMARNQLLITGQPDRQFGTPVLYLQSKVDGNIVKRAVDTDADEGRLQPTVTRRSRTPVRGDSDLQHQLLRRLDGLGPSTPAIRTLRDWVAGEEWPAEPGKALLLIKRQRRDHSEDIEMRLLCELLLGELEQRADVTGGP